MTREQARHHLSIHEEPDVAVARGRARELALAEGFAPAAATAIAIAVSEVARNIVVHAGCGEILLGTTRAAGRLGIVVVARDDHPGIADVEAALRDGWSSTGTLGLGLSGAKRLMDEFRLESAVGRGTTVTMTKWADVRRV